MIEFAEVSTTLRNLLVYAVGVGLAVTGALGLADAIELDVSISAVLFGIGLVTVVAVHEYFDGPL